jgi:sterol desaturase/sphingolipid hydroxylase (fatty acid hydroxylase superfamily)
MFIILSHIICYDIWFYFSHILLHTKWLINIHKIHHIKSYKYLVYTDTNVGHFIEGPLQNIGLFVPLLFITPKINSFIIASLFLGIRALMRHDNRCSWLIGNHHILHHKYPNYNFGEFWIDTLCGTQCPNNAEYIYGLIYI